MDCYSCDQPAINACKRCAKPYCEEHGNAQFCADCLRPESALPSFNLYRAALLTMLVGTAVAVFLFVRPPGDSNGSPLVSVGRSTATPTASGGTPPPTIPPRTPATTATAGTPTPSTSGTPAPTQSPFIEYIAQDGDTLFGIAAANLPPGDDLTEYAKAIAGLNGWDFENPAIVVGDKVLLPRPASR